MALCIYVHTLIICHKSYVHSHCIAGIPICVGCFRWLFKKSLWFQGADLCHAWSLQNRGKN